MRSGFLRSSPPALVDGFVPFFASLVALLLVSQRAHGQAVTAVPPAASAPSERARHEADLVFEMIRLQGDKPRRNAAVARDDKGAVIVRVRATARSAGKQSETAAADAVGVGAHGEPSAPMPLASVADSSIKDLVEHAAPAAGPAPLLQQPDSGEARKPGGPGPDLPAEPADPTPATETSSRLIALANPAPSFPSQWLQSLRRGSVEVRFKVQPDGSVAEAEVVSTTNRHLNQAALEAVSGWRFEPVSRTESGSVELSFDLDAN